MIFFWANTGLSPVSCAIGNFFAFFPATKKNYASHWVIATGIFFWKRKICDLFTVPVFTFNGSIVHICIICMLTYMVFTVLQFFANITKYTMNFAIHTILHKRRINKYLLRSRRCDFEFWIWIISKIISKLYKSGFMNEP